LKPEMGEKADRLKSALEVLTDSIRKANAPPRSGASAATPLQTTVPISAQGSEPVFGGELQTGLVLDPESPFDLVPDVELSYQESLDLNELGLPDLGFEEVSRQAGYWVDRNSQISRISRSVLNPLEQSLLVTNLVESLQESSFENSLPAAVVAISYVTGLQIMPVAKASLGIGGRSHVFTLDGQYHRKVWSPRPKDNEVDHIYQQQQLLTAVSLPLPEIIRTWFIGHHERLKFYTNLGSAFNVDERIIQKLIEAFVEKLRDGGRYQITLPRIACSLAVQLTINYRNPVITTLLSGSPDQPAPVLMHYQSIGVDDLRSAFEESSRQLMRF
jgi:hypothetical protein